jgi:hypothetical protein
MNRTNIYPVEATSAATARMLSDEPIQIDGMKLVFDDKVALYPAKLRVEDDNGESSRKRRRPSEE